MAPGNPAPTLPLTLSLSLVAPPACLQSQVTDTSSKYLYNEDTDDENTVDYGMAGSMDM